MDEDIKWLLRLVMAFGEGNEKIWCYLDRFATSKEAWLAFENDAGAPQTQLPKNIRAKCKMISDAAVENVLEMSEKFHTKLLTFRDPGYPKYLANSVNHPPLLFYRGDVSLLQRETLLTIVGTRNPSDYSVRAEKILLGELIAQGIVPVTGLSLGVDVIANQCALEKNCPSIAILPCGMDVDYPSENRDTRWQLYENGLVLSEFLFGMRAGTTGFHKRNHMLAAISPATFVIQIPAKSGSSITANEAAAEGRALFCLPPADIFDNQYKGVAKFLRNGATPVFEAADILPKYERHHEISHSTAKTDAREITPQKTIAGFQPGKLQRNPPKTQGEFQVIPREIRAKDSALALDVAMLSKRIVKYGKKIEKHAEILPDRERAILHTFHDRNIVYLNEIQAETQLDMNTVLTTITTLELKGKVQLVQGEYIQRRTET